MKYRYLKQGSSYRPNDLSKQNGKTIMLNINTKLIDLLPEEVSHEIVYQLADFMFNLAIAFQNHCSDQLNRSIKHSVNQLKIQYSIENNTSQD